jgi:hypothetical protein
MSRARFSARGVQFSGRGLNPPAMLVLEAPVPTDRAAPSRAHIPLEFSSALSLMHLALARWSANSVPRTAHPHYARRSAAGRFTLCSGSRVEGSGLSRHLPGWAGGPGTGQRSTADRTFCSGGATQSAGQPCSVHATYARAQHMRATQSHLLPTDAS